MAKDSDFLENAAEDIENTFLEVFSNSPNVRNKILAS